MRIVFAGTPDFAAVALQALLDARLERADGATAAESLEVVQVLTQPDRPAGRGLRRAPSPVRQLATARRVPVATPASLSLAKGGIAAQEAHALMRAAQADVIVVAAYGLILPQVVLDMPEGLPDAGCGRITAINIHASLLPRWRGAAPVARAIEAGDRETGTTIMQMDAGLDTGPMLLREPMPIDASATTATLTAQLAAQGARLIVSALRAAAHGELRAAPQPLTGIAYATKLDKREAWIDFNGSAMELAFRVRAFDPFPGAAAVWRAIPLKFWRAQATDAAEITSTTPGTVLRADASGLLVACGAGALRILQLQRPGGRRVDAAQFLAGTPIAPGDVLHKTPAT